MKILSQRETFAYRLLYALTDEEYEQHRQHIDRTLTELGHKGVDTRTMPEYRYTGSHGRSRWSRDRLRQHNEVIRHFYDKMRSAPQEGKGLMLGGLGGAGKGHAMNQPHIPLDASRYFTVDPDEIKKEMVRRGMVPQVDHLSPMESTGLAHEEASELAKRLARLGYRDKRNLAWDITMSSDESVAGRIEDMRKHGYGQVDGAFIDASPEVARSRVVKRHRKDEEPFRDAGQGVGGRYVQEELTKGHLPSPESGLRSKNAEVFDRQRKLFDNSILIDGDTSMPQVVNQHGNRWSQLPGGQQLPTWQPPSGGGGGTFFPTHQMGPQQPKQPPRQQQPPSMMPTRQIRNTQVSRRVVPDGYIYHDGRRR